MCESNAYILKDGKEELFLEDVDILRPERDGIYLRNIFGEEKEIKAHVKSMSLVNHRIILEENTTYVFHPGKKIKRIFGTFIFPALGRKLTLRKEVVGVNPINCTKCDRVLDRIKA